MDLTGTLRHLAIAPSIQFALASVATMLILALLDLVGAVFAKEWVDTRNPLCFTAGIAAFVILIAFYAGSLKAAELSIVTIGWVVFLQVGLLLYERVRYEAALSPVKWMVIILILGLQAYLVLVPNDHSSQGIAGDAEVMSRLDDGAAGDNIP